MAYTAFTSTEIEVGKAIKKSLWTKTKDNFADHETRITDLEASASKIILVDEIIELDRPRTGDVKFSMLTESQFQSRFGVDWELIKGQSISGSDLASLYGATLPDARDRFPRVLASSGKSIGQTETSQNKAHTHYIQDSNEKQIAKDTGSGGVLADRLDSTNADCWTAGLQEYIKTLSDGGTEARPDSIIFNAFTRKNDYEIDQVRLFKAPSNFTFLSAICTNLIAGSAGTLEIDVLKGATLGSLTSVFSTRPSVSYSEGNNASSTNAVFSTASVTANEWIQTDITSLQTNQHRFHLYLIGESN